MKYFIEVTFVLAIIILLILFVAHDRPFRDVLRVSYISTASMEPVLKVGSIAILTKGKDYRIGDIVSFVSPRSGEIIAHRITGVEEERGVTLYSSKGDRNDLPDPWRVSKNQVLGKVLISIPFLGSLAFFGKTIKGLILLVYIPAFLIVLNEVACITKLVRKHTGSKGNDIIRL